jgi:hypothetical protein
MTSRGSSDHPRVSAKAVSIARPPAVCICRFRPSVRLDRYSDKRAVHLFPCSAYHAPAKRSGAAPAHVSGASQSVVTQRGRLGVAQAEISISGQWNWFPARPKFGGPAEQTPFESRSKHSSGVGEGPVAMRTIVQLDRTMQLPLNLATGLRTIFRDAGSSPVPEQLAALVRQLGSDSAESSEDEHK